MKYSQGKISYDDAREQLRVSDVKMDQLISSGKLFATHVHFADRTEIIIDDAILFDYIVDNSLLKGKGERYGTSPNNQQRF